MVKWVIRRAGSWTTDYQLNINQTSGI